MARDRQRAKQRKARRRAGGGGNNPGPRLSEPRRSDVPGELEHSSGEVDEFEAALVAGAEGQQDDLDERTDGAAQDAEAEEELTPEELSPEDFEELEEEVDEYEERAEGRAPADEVEDRELEREALRSTPARRPAPGAPTRTGPGRFIGFLQASWAELQRVQWPDRRQVAQATAVVIGFVIVAGLYLGVADWVAKKIVNAII
jgi:preprotein translocase subunit SecE